jgi:lipid-A-disaccharide synthase
MLSCGESSGDLYAGALVSSLRALGPHVEVFGFGGDRMASAGARLVGDYRGFSVTGLVEALAVVRKSWSMLRALGEAARVERPDVFVAIDFPDFNFRLLPTMQRLGVPIVYYVSPQIWAWRPKRIDTIRRYVNRMLVIFPFEAGFYEQAHVPAEFVGHPLVDLAKATEARETFLSSRGLAPSRRTLALLPGSRPNELRQILPTVVEAVKIVAAKVSDVQCVIARAPALDSALFAPLDALRAADVPFQTVEGATDNVLAAADVVVTASGTATIQAALHERPMVVVYRLAPTTYALGRRFVRVRTYGMVNLVAGSTIVPELSQRFTAGAAGGRVRRRRSRSRRQDAARSSSGQYGRLADPASARGSPSR